MLNFNKDLLEMTSKVPLNIQVFEKSGGKYTIENDNEIENLRKENRTNYYNGKISTKDYIKINYDILSKIKIEPVVIFSSTKDLPF